MRLFSLKLCLIFLLKLFIFLWNLLQNSHCAKTALYWKIFLSRSENSGKRTRWQGKRTVVAGPKIKRSTLRSARMQQKRNWRNGVGGSSFSGVGGFPSTLPAPLSGLGSLEQRYDGSFVLSLDRCALTFRNDPWKERVRPFVLGPRRAIKIGELRWLVLRSGGSRGLNWEVGYGM